VPEDREKARRPGKKEGGGEIKEVEGSWEKSQRGEEKYELTPFVADVRLKVKVPDGATSCVERGKENRRKGASA